MREVSCGGPYLVLNAGSDAWNYQVKELAEAVARLIPGVDVSINRDAQPDKRSYKVDFSLFKTLAPANQPEYDLNQTICNLRDRLSVMGFNDQDFRNSRFIRLKVLEYLENAGLLTERLGWIFKP